MFVSLSLVKIRTDAAREVGRSVVVQATPPFVERYIVELVA
jgi:hypothetical protein